MNWLLKKIRTRVVADSIIRAYSIIPCSPPERSCRLIKRSSQNEAKDSLSLHLTPKRIQQLKKHRKLQAMSSGW